MAFCSQCGSLLGDDDRVCPMCGAPVDGGGASAADRQDAGRAGEPTSPTRGVSAGFGGDAAPGALKSAWMDFKRSPGKLPIILKLALFQFVPGVGGLVQSGYAYAWGREQALGRHRPMPTKIIRPGVLDTGLYVYGVSLIAMVATCAAILILGDIFESLGLSFVYFLLLLAFAVAVVPFLQVMFLRTAIAGRVRSGVNLKKAWSLFAAPGKTGGAFAASWAPSLIATAIVVLIWIAFFLVIASIGTVSAPMMYLGAHAGGAALSLLEAYMVSTVLLMLPLVALALFATFFTFTAASIVTARAIGYWARDFHPDEWEEYRENARHYMDQAI